MTIDNKIPLIVIVGPTASGKTSLAIKVAKHFDGEIVSADSMQIYKGIDIATAKPTVDEQNIAKHHMIDFLDITENFSVAQYCELAHKVIADIHSRSKLPILVGGTGLYIDSVVDNIAFSDADCDDNLRKELYSLYEENGVKFLLQMLSKFDPISAENLSEQKNVKRIIRAIEVYKTTGITITEHNKNSKAIESPYYPVKIGLTATDRQYLYDRINTRVDIMVENGLVEEAQVFSEKLHSNTSSMAIGHKELLPYINGENDLDICIDNLKMQTRRYAKRQLTWFNRDKNIHWFNIDELNTQELTTQAISTINKVLFDEKQ